MTFALQRGERFDVGARRVAREGAELALAAIANQDDLGVHEARRTIKRLRALVRLIGPAIGDAEDEANEALRDASQDFAGSRDSTVILATFDAIAGRDVEHPVRNVLVGARKGAQRNDIDASTKIRAFAASAEAWTFEGRWSALEPGMRRTYRAGRRALRDESELHELRKRSKDLQFQLTLLRVAWPDVIGGYLDALRKLGDMLGEEHDLWMLAEVLKKEEGVEVFCERIRERREKLHKKIIPLATRMYVDKPRNWTKRLGVWWAP